METTAEATNKKNKVAPIIAGVLFLIIIGFVASKVIHGMHYEETDNAQLEANIVPVSSRISSFVEKIYVQDNQFVKKGDTLVVLNPSDFAIRLKQAELAFANAQAQLGVIGSNTKTASVNASAVGSNILTAKANAEAAKVRLWKANQEYERYGKLLQLQSVTQQQFDGVKAEKETAEKLSTVAESQLSAAREQSSASQSQASSVGSQMKPAEILAQQRVEEVNFAKLNLSYTVILAPEDGYVSKKNIQIGQLLSPGQTLMYIVNSDDIWTVANFKETQLEKMKVGQEVEVEVDAYSGLKLKGKVESIQSATGNKFSLIPADNASGNFVKVVQRIPVKITFDSKDLKNKALKSGMNCTVSVHVK